MKVILFLSFLTTSSLIAQLGLSNAQEVTDAQARQIFVALRAAGTSAKDVVYPIYSDGKRISYGISIGGGKLLAKASELIQKRGLYTANRERTALNAVISGVYTDHDLAVLEVPGLKAPTVEWADAGNLSEGTFLSAIRPDGEAQAMGVLSVRERSLKSTDQGFLGIEMDTLEAGKGVRVKNVVEGSAADEVGIRQSDIIVKIAGQEVKGFYELSTKLRRLKNGEQPEIELLRNEEILQVRPILKGREIREGVSRRLEKMDQMSGGQSRVRGGFGNVIQSDMELEVEDAGLPIVDLDGRIIGMVIARAGRISTLILPGDDIINTLKNPPAPFAREEDKMPLDQQVQQGVRRDRVRRELGLMRRMMENLQRELERD